MPIFARLTRGQVIAIRNEEYIDGARAIGLPDRWIIIKYVLPNVMSPILVQSTLAIASAIIAEASLSFLVGAAAAQSVLGVNAQHRERFSLSRRRGCPFSPAWQFSLPCRALIYLATGCAMRSIRATTKES